MRQYSNKSNLKEKVFILVHSSKYNGDVKAGGAGSSWPYHTYCQEAVYACRCFLHTVQISLTWEWPWGWDRHLWELVWSPDGDPPGPDQPPPA